MISLRIKAFRSFIIIGVCSFELVSDFCSAPSITSVGFSPLISILAAGSSSRSLPNACKKTSQQIHVIFALPDVFSISLSFLYLDRRPLYFLIIFLVSVPIDSLTPVAVHSILFLIPFVPVFYEGLFIPIVLHSTVKSVLPEIKYRNFTLYRTIIILKNYFFQYIKKYFFSPINLVFFSKSIF